MNFTAEMEGGKGSSRGNLLPSKRDYPGGVELGLPAMIPGQIVLCPPNTRGWSNGSSLFINRGRRHLRLLAGVASFDLSAYSTSSVVYSRNRSLLTPVTAVW